jgi:hypothetical protein
MTVDKRPADKMTVDQMTCCLNKVKKKTYLLCSKSRIVTIEKTVLDDQLSVETIKLVFSVLTAEITKLECLYSGSAFTRQYYTRIKICSLLWTNTLAYLLPTLSDKEKSFVMVSSTLQAFLNTSATNILCVVVVL